MSKRPHALQRLVAQPEEVPERESRVQCGYAQQKVAADLMYIRNEPRISSDWRGQERQPMSEQCNIQTQERKREPTGERYSKQQ
jgi:hypothetical protein